MDKKQLVSLIDLFEKISGPLVVIGGFEKVILFPEVIQKIKELKPDLYK